MVGSGGCGHYSWHSVWWVLVGVVTIAESLWLAQCVVGPGGCGHYSWHSVWWVLVGVVTIAGTVCGGSWWVWSLWLAQCVVGVVTIAGTVYGRSWWVWSL